VEASTLHCSPDSPAKDSIARETTIRGHILRHQDTGRPTLHTTAPLTHNHPMVAEIAGQAGMAANRNFPLRGQFHCQLQAMSPPPAHTTMTVNTRRNIPIPILDLLPRRRAISMQTKHTLLRTRQPGLHLNILPGPTVEVTGMDPGASEVEASLALVAVHLEVALRTHNGTRMGKEGAMLTTAGTSPHQAKRAMCHPMQCPKPLQTATSEPRKTPTMSQWRTRRTPSDPQRICKSRTPVVATIRSSLKRSTSSRSRRCHRLAGHLQLGRKRTLPISSVLA
jgi:hypothetical protein